MTEYHFQTAQLEDVLQFFADHFDEKTHDGKPRRLAKFGGPRGEHVWNETYVDTAKGIVVFKLKPVPTGDGEQR